MIERLISLMLYEKNAMFLLQQDEGYFFENQHYITVSRPISFFNDIVDQLIVEVTLLTSFIINSLTYCICGIQHVREYDSY
jgi:hypothetical protein